LLSAGAAHLGDIRETAAILQCLRAVAVVFPFLRTYLRGAMMLKSAITGTTHEDPNISLQSTRLLAVLLNPLPERDLNVERILSSLETLAPLSVQHSEATSEVLYALGVQGIRGEVFHQALGLWHELVRFVPSDRVIILAAEFTAEAVASGHLEALRRVGVIEELAGILEDCWELCDSTLTYPLLGVTAATLDAGWLEFARVLRWKAYDAIVRANAFETAALALDIVATLMMAGENGCWEFFEHIGALETYPEVFVEPAPFEALPVWVRFCFASARGRATAVYTGLLNGGFVSLLPQCAETEDAQIVGCWLSVVLMMTNAALELQDEDGLREALSEEGVRAKMDEIVAWKDVFELWDGEGREAVIGEMAAAILGFVRRGED
jgi:hypothetical protein